MVLNHYSITVPEIDPHRKVQTELVGLSAAKSSRYDRQSHRFLMRLANLDVRCCAHRWGERRLAYRMLTTSVKDPAGASVMVALGQRRALVVDKDVKHQE